MARDTPVGAADSAAAIAPGTPADSADATPPVTPADSTGAADPPETVADSAEADQTVTLADSTVAPDSTALASEESGGGGPGRVSAPRLSVSGESNWLTGDTLYALFSMPGAADPDSTAVEQDSALCLFRFLRGGRTRRQGRCSTGCGSWVARGPSTHRSATARLRAIGRGTT